MNPRTTGSLALVTLLLGGFIYFYEVEGAPARQQLRDEAERIFPGIESGAIDAVEFTTQDGVPARFERREGRWMLVAPVVARANASALDAITDALAALARVGTVASPDGLDQYGLGDGARRLGFEVAGASMGMRIGGSTPVGGHLYVARLEGDALAESVDYVERFRVNSIKRDLDDLRERKIFQFDIGDIRTLRVDWPSPHGETQVALARDAAGVWQMGAPTVGRADQQTIRELLTDLSYLNAQGFVDARGDAVSAALAETGITFYWTRQGDHVERRARIGSDFREGRLLEGPDGRLYTIDPARMDDFATTVAAYRFKTISEFEVARAARLRLDFAGTSGAEQPRPTRIEVLLGEQGWTGGEPAIEPNRASGLIRLLAHLRAVDIVADEMGPNELTALGLLPAQVRIQVTDRNTSEGAIMDVNADSAETLADVSIGRLIEGRGLFMQRAGDPSVYLASVETAQSIPISHEAYESRFTLDADAETAVDFEPDLEILEVDPF